MVSKPPVQFLNRIYTYPFAKLPIGKARYGIILRDDGIVMDGLAATRCDALALLNA